MRSVVRSVLRDFSRNVLRNSISNSVNRREFTLGNTTGALTPPAIGDTDGNRLTIDEESLWHPCKAEEARFWGMRRVENLLSFSEDLTQDWVAQSGVTLAATLYTLSLNSNKSAYINNAATGVLEGETYIWTLDITPDRSGTIDFRARDGAFAAASDITSATCEMVAGTRVRLSLPITIPSSPDGALCLFFFVNEDGAANTYNVTVHNQQLENSTGRSDTVTPSEYVSTGVGTGSELVTNGDFATGDTTGWTTTAPATATYDSGEVDLARNSSGSPYGQLYQTIATVEGGTYLLECDVSALSHQVGAFLDTSTQDLGTTTSTGKFAVVFIASGASARLDVAARGSTVATATIDNITVKQIDHGSNVDSVKNYATLNGNSVASNVVTEAVGANITASTIKGLFMEGAATELSGYSGDLVNWTLTTTAAAVKDATGLTGEPNEAFTVTDNSASVREAREEATNITSGTDTYYMVCYVAYNASPSVYPRLVITHFNGGTQVVEGIILDPSDGSYNEQSSDGAVVSITRIGNFWQVVLSLADNGTGNASSAVALSPAFNTDGSTTENVAAQGSTVFASCELYKTTYSASPVLTTGGTTKARLADTEYTLPAAYWTPVDAEGSMSFDLTPLFNTASGSSQGIVSPDATNPSRLSYFTNTDLRLSLRDGTASALLDSAWSGVLDSVAIKARWGSSTMRFSSDGTSSVSQTFDGSFNPSGNLVIGKSLTGGMCIKNLILYSSDHGDAWL